MKWLKYKNWSERAKAFTLVGVLGLAALSIAAVGTAHLEKGYLSRATLTKISGRQVVTAWNNVAVGDITPGSGAFTTLASTGAGTFPGANTFGAGTQGVGYVITDSSELITNDGAVGTLTTIPVPGSSTVYVEADVMGNADTGTGFVMYKIEGTFDRDGTGNMTSGGTDTQWFSGSLDLTVDDQSEWTAYFVADTDGSDDAIQLVVDGTNTRTQWIANVKYTIVTTTGAL